MHVCVRERVRRLAGGEVVEGRVGWRLAGGKNPARLSMILKKCAREVVDAAASQSWRPASLPRRQRDSDCRS